MTVKPSQIEILDPSLSECRFVFMPFPQSKMGFPFPEPLAYDVYGRSILGLQNCNCENAIYPHGHFTSSNAHSADDWLSVLQRIVAHYRDRPLKRFDRGDAAFANRDLCS